MKKLLFVLAFVAVYGVSMATTNATVVKAEKSQVTFVAGIDYSDFVAPEGEKVEKVEKEKKEVKAESKAKAKGEVKAEAKAEAKSEGCAGEAKKECGSACGGKK